jgi:ornithine cyclodeaminase/alanine dehydrogenase-like protein (mu-crystallin family)
VDNLKQHLDHGRFLRSVIDRGIVSEQDVSSEICEIVAGKKKGRTSDNELIIFITRGMGCLDVAVATHVYRQAIAKGLGTRFSFVNYDPSNFL